MIETDTNTMSKPSSSPSSIFSRSIPSLSTVPSTSVVDGRFRPGAVLLDYVAPPTLEELAIADPGWADFLKQRTSKHGKNIKPLKRISDPSSESPEYGMLDARSDDDVLARLDTRPIKRARGEVDNVASDYETVASRRREMARRRAVYEGQRASNIRHREQVAAELFRSCIGPSSDIPTVGRTERVSPFEQANTKETAFSMVFRPHLNRKTIRTNSERTGFTSPSSESRSEDPYPKPSATASVVHRHTLRTSSSVQHSHDILSDYDVDWSDGEAEDESSTEDGTEDGDILKEVSLLPESAPSLSRTARVSRLTMAEEHPGQLEWKAAALTNANLFVVVGCWDRGLSRPVGVLGCRSCYAVIPPYAVKGHIGSDGIAERQKRKEKGRWCGTMTRDSARAAAEGVLDYLQQNEWLPAEGRHDKGNWLFAGVALPNALPIFPVALKFCCLTCHRGFVDKWSAKAHCNKHHPEVDRTIARWSERPAQCLRMGAEWNELEDTSTNRAACDDAAQTSPKPALLPSLPALPSSTNYAANPWETPLYREFSSVMGWTTADFGRLPENKVELSAEPMPSESGLACVRKWFDLWKNQISIFLESSALHNVRKALNSAKGGYKTYPLSRLLRTESEQRYSRSQFRLVCWALRLSKLGGCGLQTNDVARGLLHKTWELADEERLRSSSNATEKAALSDEWARILHMQALLFALHQPLDTLQLSASNRQPGSIWSSYTMSFALVIGLDSKGQLPREVNSLSGKMAQLTRFIREICLGEILLNNGNCPSSIARAVDVLRPHFSDGSASGSTYPFGLYRYGMRYLRNDHGSRRTVKDWMVEQNIEGDKFRIVGLPESELQQSWTTWRECGQRIRRAMERLREDFFEHCLCGCTLEELGLSKIDVHFADSSREPTPYYTRCPAWAQAKEALWNRFQRGSLRKRFFLSDEPNARAWKAWIDVVCRWCCQWATLDWTTTVPCRLRATFSCRTERGMATGRDVFWVEDARILKIVREDKSVTTSGKRYYTPRMSMKTMSEMKLLCDLLVHPTAVGILNNTDIPLSVFKLPPNWTREQVVEHFQTSHDMFNLVPDYAVQLKLWAKEVRHVSSTITGYSLTSQKWRQFCFGGLLGRLKDYGNVMEFEQQLLVEGGSEEIARLAMVGHSKRTEINSYEGQRTESLPMVLSGPLAHYQKICADVRRKWHLEDE
ncbi:hypothetical protein CALVIDRAFT_411896 [Calocera viscosa TUFC12733]|uniref:C2H2-type domain-containing protein n=1 Tax=Calocera viscosa (strain TUFC12733) TaxID=1330018 RepID=A0A167G4Y6_CALVF|nr:hypothetical protein CALVIDRAFT_411896 [Calocera viscosa TUFC12733]